MVGEATKQTMKKQFGKNMGILNPSRAFIETKNYEYPM
jgi:hypothetical protein